MNSLEDFHDTSVSMVRMQYASNTDDDYDMPAMLAVFSEEDGVDIFMFSVEDNPMNYVKNILARVTNAKYASFVSPCIVRDPETRNVTGENVMVMSESTTERLCTALNIERKPIPTITKESSSRNAFVRVSLLYQEKAH